MATGIVALATARKPEAPAPATSNKANSRQGQALTAVCLAGCLQNSVWPGVVGVLRLGREGLHAFWDKRCTHVGERILNNSITRCNAVDCVPLIDQTKACMRSESQA